MENPINSRICEENTFSIFFNKNCKALRNYLYFKYGNEETAYDIAQEAFIKLWENCKNVPLDKAIAYLYTIANNASLNVIAHQKVKLNFKQNYLQTTSTNQSPEFLLQEKEFELKLEKAINSLTEGQKTAFLLNRIEGKKYHEIAEMLGISVKAVEKRIHGALIGLRKEIEELK